MRGNILICRDIPFCFVLGIALGGGECTNNLSGMYGHSRKWYNFKVCTTVSKYIREVETVCKSGISNRCKFMHKYCIFMHMYV